jgi:hypothetical protein
MTTKKPHTQGIEPSDEELQVGVNTAIDLVAHMKRMGASETSFHIPDGAGEWVVLVEWKSKKEAKPN